MDKKSLKKYLKNIPEEKTATKRILENMSCKEFRENLKRYPDFSEIYRNKELRFRMLMHIKSIVFPENNCKSCLVLFAEYLKELEQRQKENK